MPTKTRIDETRTAVSTADSTHPSVKGTQETIEISSDSSSDYELEENDASDVEDDGKDTNQKKTTSLPENGVNGDTEMAEAAEEGNDDEEAEPTFGDLVRGNTTVDVAASLQESQQKASATSSTALTKPSRAIAPPTLSSLGTVLNQALKTNDKELLESCLTTTDLPTIRATISRMDSSLAGDLLFNLASRMHRRPGRANSLMTWVQWTLVSHGGALAGRADLVERLSELNRVLEERSRGLQSLLTLKGKLDMLDSQMQLRRENRARRREEEEEDKEEEDEEEGVIYVEGEEDVEVNGGGKRIPDDEDVMLANGIGGESDDDEDEDEESDDDMDAELDVMGEDDLDEDEVDFDDVEEEDDEDESEAEVAAPPAKLRKTAKSTPKRR
jgi:U3 small nucleolar RNA-associated protein 5